MPTKQGIKVRGKCPQGHQYTTTAPPGRVTWTGPCPTCSEKMTARRLPAGEQSALVDPAPDDPAAGKLVVKKARYKDAPPDPRPEEPDEGETPPDDDPDDEQAGGAGAGADGGSEPDSVGGNPGIQEGSRGPDPEPDAGGEPAAGADRDGPRRGPGGRFRRARGRRSYPGVPYGA